MSDGTERPGSGHFKGLAYHHMLLADVHRMDAYDRAIRALVEPGMVVLDLGTGTGILAMLAAKRGAARVYAVESTPIAGLATQLVQRNGLEQIVQVHRADIRDLSPIEPVDLIVSDFMGRFLVDDHMLTAVAASRAWLAPEGRYCPGLVGLRVAPVGNVWLNALELFADPIYGLDFGAAHDATLNATYASQLAPAALLSPPQVFVDYDPRHTEPADLARQMRFVLTRPGRLQALAGWFVAELADDVRLSTEPGIQSHWGQTMFPLPPCMCEVGDQVSIELVLERAEPQRWRWRGQVRRDGETLVSFDQVSDLPLDRGDE